jgi:lipoate-protein ligase A
MTVPLEHDLDPFRHLAVEDAWLDRRAAEGPALILWRSGPAVVIGKNQNPWRECHLPRLRRTNTVLARRISGGGAVYHDPGNLNLSVLVPRSQYSESRYLAFFIDALRAAGFAAAPMGRHGLGIEGRKISGNAFCLRGRGALHHGTLLVRADLDRLTELLRPPPWSIATRAIASIPSPVMNLSELRPEVTLAALEACFTAAFRRHYPEGRTVAPEEELDPGEVDRRRRTLAGWDWIYGHTPRFAFRLQPEPDAALILRVARGRIEGLQGDSQGLSNVVRARLEDRLRDRPFSARTVAEGLADAGFRSWGERVFDEEF